MNKHKGKEDRRREVTGFEIPVTRGAFDRRKYNTKNTKISSNLHLFLTKHFAKALISEVSQYQCEALKFNRIKKNLNIKKQRYESRGFSLFTTHDTDESVSKLVFPGM